MTKEWKWNSKSGKAFFHAGCGRQDAVGTEKPSDAIPIQEGTKLLVAKGVDRILFFALTAGVLRLLTHRKRNKYQRIKRKISGIRKML